MNDRQRIGPKTGELHDLLQPSFAHEIFQRRTLRTFPDNDTHRRGNHRGHYSHRFNKIRDIFLGFQAGRTNEQQGGWAKTEFLSNLSRVSQTFERWIDETVRDQMNARPMRSVSGQHRLSD